MKLIGNKRLLKLQFTTGIRYESPTWEAGTSFSFVTKRLRNRDGGLILTLPFGMRM